MGKPFILFFQFLDNYRADACESTNPLKRPGKNLFAHAVTSSQILLLWTKDLGNGYRYKINVKLGQSLIKILEGTMSFGNMSAVVVNGLPPGQTYDFEVYHACASNPTAFSRSRTKGATTLAQGKFHSMLRLNLFC